MALLLVVAGSCSSDDGPAGPGAGGLPPCASDLPLPAGVEVVEVTAEPSDENPTCAVTLASAEPVDDLTVAWRGALDDGGVEHSAVVQDGVQAVLRMEGPVCGSVLLFAAGTDRVTDAVPDDRTPALVSILECPPR